MPIAPAWAFNAGTLGFCKPISLPELLLTLTYVTLSLVLALVGGATMDVTGYFGFEKVRCLYILHMSGHSMDVKQWMLIPLVATPGILRVCCTGVA